VGAIVVTWYILAPHLEQVPKWPTIAIATLGVIPGTLLLVLIALPLWQKRWLLPATIVLVLAAVICWLAGWGLAGNFAKLWAAVFAGWTFLKLFEQLSWVLLVAIVVPVVDLLSVWRGPTHALTRPETFHVYTAVAIAFLLPGGEAFSFGPPDILFFALFLAAAARWHLRIVGTWLAMTGMYSLTVVIATNTHFHGLAGLPFLSFGFLLANADLFWRRLRRPSADSSGSPGASSAGDGPAPS
jgi:hypothetical protein